MKILYSPFKDQYQCHILKGNLKAVKENELGKIFSKSTKCKDPENFNFKQAREDVINGVDDCIAVWYQEGVKSAVLQQLKNKVKQLIHDLRGKLCKKD